MPKTTASNQNNDHTAKKIVRLYCALDKFTGSYTNGLEQILNQRHDSLTTMGIDLIEDMQTDAQSLSRIIKRMSRNVGEFRDAFS